MPNNKYEASFSVDVTGDVTGDKFPGSFKVKTRLSFRDTLECDKVRRALLGNDPAGATPRVSSIADIFSQLAVRVVESPSWWQNSDGGMELTDDNVVREVFEGMLKVTADAAAEVKKRAADAKKDLASDKE